MLIRVLAKAADGEHHAFVPVTISLGTWGELDVLLDGDPIPPLLSAVDFPWKDDDGCWPVVLIFRWSGRTAPYVAVASPDGPLLDGVSICSADDLDGFVLTEPALSLHCFACDTDFAGLYPDRGLPLFGRNLDRHRLAMRCPACDADYSGSKLMAVRIAPRT